LIKKLLLFPIVFLAVSSAQASGVKHFFTAFVGPFNAATAEFEYDLSAASYAVRSVIRTNGTFDTIYPFQAQYETGGKIIGEKMRPANYKYESKSRFSKRSKQTFFDASGLPLYSISTKNGKSKRKDVRKKIAENDSTDLQTVLGLIVQRYYNVRFCAARLPVFDGKRRYDVIVEDEGKENLEAVAHSPYAGNAVKCSIYIDKLQEKGDDLLWELASDRRIYFWIMEDTKSKLPFIARIKINETPLGQANVYTTKIEVTK